MPSCADAHTCDVGWGTKGRAMGRCALVSVHLAIVKFDHACLGLGQQRDDLTWEPVIGRAPDGDSITLYLSADKNLRSIAGEMLVSHIR